MKRSSSKLLILPWYFHNLFNSPLILFFVLLKEFSCSHISRRTCIWITKKRTNWSQHCNYIIHWTPFIIKNIKAYISIVIYVWMKHFGFEHNFWWFIWVVFRELDFQNKYSSLPNTINRAMDDCIPGL